MALPPVKMQITMGGVPQVLNALKTLERAVAQHEQRTATLQANSNRRKLTDAERYLKDMSKIQAREQKEHEKYERDYERLLSRREAAERKAARESERISKQNLREQEKALKLEHKMQQDQLRGKFGLLSNIMQTLGLGGLTRHTRIAAQLMGGGRGGAGLMGAAEEGVGAAGGAGMGAAGLGSMAGLGAAGMGAIAVAAAGVVAGLWILKKGVTLVANALEASAHEMISGVTQIGGGFSISDALVRGAKAERLATTIAINAPFEKEKVPARELLVWSTQMAKTTEHSQMEWLQAVKDFQELTGKTRDFIEDASFFGKLSSVSGTGLSQIAQSAAGIGVAFPKFSKEDVRNLMLKQWQLGMEGAIEIKDQQQANKIISAASQFKGGATPENVIRTLAQAQIARRAVADPAEAFTAVERFNDFIVRRSQDFKNLGFHAVLGMDKKTGNKIIENPAQAMVDAALIFRRFPEKVEHLFGERGKGVAKAVSGIIGEPGAGETRKQFNDRAVKMIEDMMNVSSSMENLDNRAKEVSETIEVQLKKAFNEITTAVGTELVSALKDHKDEIVGFIKEMITSTPILIEQFKLMASVLPLLGSAILALTPVLLAIGQYTAKSAALTAGIFGHFDEMERMLKVEDELIKIRSDWDKKIEARRTEKANIAIASKLGGVMTPAVVAMAAAAGGGFAGIGAAVGAAALTARQTEDVGSGIGESAKKEMLVAAPQIGEAIARSFNVNVKDPNVNRGGGPIRAPRGVTGDW